MPKVFKRLSIRTDNFSTLSRLADLDLEHRKLLGWLMFGVRSMSLRDALQVATTPRQANLMIIQNGFELSKFYEDKLLFFNGKRVA